MGLHNCGGPHPPLFQYIHREPGADHAGEEVALWGMCTSVRQRCDWSHLGEDTQLKRRKKLTTITCGVKCRDTAWCHSSGLRALDLN